MYNLTIFKNHWDNQGSKLLLSFQQIYKLVSKIEQINKEEQQAFIGGVLQHNNKEKSNEVINRSLLTLDIDDSPYSPQEISNMIKHNHIIYTTFSHGLTINSRVRVIIPLENSVESKYYNNLVADYIETLPKLKPYIDNVSKSVKFLMFFGGTQSIDDIYTNIVTNRIEAYAPAELKEINYTHNKTHDLSLELPKLQEALSKISSDDYTTWLSTGISLYNSFGDEAFSLWDDWSKGSASYGKTKNKWASFKGSNRQAERFLASIYYDAGMSKTHYVDNFENIQIDDNFIGNTAAIYEEYYGESFRHNINAIFNNCPNWFDLFPNHIIKDNTFAIKTVTNKKEDLYTAVY
jgi:hypothetical protein